jgi:alkanesulfonate monooxygenase SsuD/methylene tetrahydromethanopterin reductase-like flavin-dependent oxidoreductase (luciferase family)
MRSGIFIGPFDLDAGLEQQIEWVVSAERDGFDSLWTAQPRWADALTMLALAGQRTERIELGTAVIQSFARHPFVLAQQSATVQPASGGRFALGIGLASRESIEDQLGLSYARSAVHMQEYLSVLRCARWRTTGPFPSTARSTRSSWRPWALECCESPASWPTAPSRG